MRVRYKYTIFLPLLIILAISVARNYWLPLVAKNLIVNDKPVISDLIVVPSGNDEDLRVEYAAELYKRGFAPKILLSGKLSLEKETDINLGKIYALSLGVPGKDILLENESGSTFENAMFSKKIIERRKDKSIILVTYPIHTRRSRLVFRKIFPKDVRIITACDIGSFNLNQWWRKKDLTRKVAYEYFAFLWSLLFKS